MQKYENQNVSIEGGGAYSILNTEFSGRDLPDSFMEHFDKLLEAAKGEKEVLTLINRLFSDSTLLSYPVGENLGEGKEFKGLYAYELFRQMNDTERKKALIDSAENNYKRSIKKIFATLYGANIARLYLPPERELKFYSPHTRLGNKLTLGELEPLDKSPKVKAYLSDFYEKELKLPVPSTLKKGETSK